MQKPSYKLCAYALLTISLAAAGCSDSHDHDSENEVITTVSLTFTPTAGMPIVRRFNDADGEGGAPPVIDPITLPAGAYTLGLTFENRLESPPEDITAEIKDTADEHQIFFIGTAVSGAAPGQTTGPLEHAYKDTDKNGLPLGLENTITATAGMGTLTVVLRHMPPANGKPVKVAMLAETVRASGLMSIGGSSDVEVNFPVTVTP